MKGWLFGGENSGHILCLDKHTTGDGIVSALQVLTALRQEGGAPGQLLGELSLYPQLLINVPLVKGFRGKTTRTSTRCAKKSSPNLKGRAVCCCVLPARSPCCSDG